MAESSQAKIDKLLRNALEIAKPFMEECVYAQHLELKKLMKKCISEEVELINKFEALCDVSELPDTELQRKIREHLSEEDCKKASAFVDRETFTIEIIESKATFQRENKVFRDPIEFNSEDAITLATVYQIASLLVEAFLLILSVLGIRDTLKGDQVKTIIIEIKSIIRDDAFRKMVNEFLQAWRTGNAWGKAKAIFFLLQKSNGFGIFWRSVHMFFWDMPWSERARNLALIAAYIAAAFASEGISLIVRIVLVVNNALNMKRKIENLIQLEDLAFTFRK